MSHGICMRNNPNCGVGVKGCSREFDKTEDEINDIVYDSISDYFNGYPNDSMTLIDHVEDAIDSCMHDIRGYESYACDNELLSALVAISEFVEIKGG
jgi:hypothetical protein